VPRPILARIDLTALAHNHTLLRQCAGRAKVWVVAKANGYGHGLVRVARTLRNADGFAVLDLNDAVRLRTP
jgi:alanine racemase